jgi:hypothetical protein
MGLRGNARAMLVRTVNHVVWANAIAAIVNTS